VALDSVSLCRFSFPSIAALAGRVPGLQQHLFKLLSEDIGKAALLAGNFTADERLAAFVVSISRRHAARGFSASRFRLSMTRTDIANYLRLASESVSRGFSRLQDAGLLRVDRREIEILDSAKLTVMARNILRE
jgi:CRP/FNR family transcriptional regulator